MLNVRLCAKLITYNTMLAIQHSTYAAQFSFLKKEQTNKNKNKHTNGSRSQRHVGKHEEKLRKRDPRNQ